MELRIKIFIAFNKIKIAQNKRLVTAVHSMYEMSLHKTSFPHLDSSFILPCYGLLIFFFLNLETFVKEEYTVILIKYSFFFQLILCVKIYFRNSKHLYYSKNNSQNEKY